MRRSVQLFILRAAEGGGFCTLFAPWCLSGVVSAPFVLEICESSRRDLSEGEGEVLLACVVAGSTMSTTKCGCWDMSQRIVRRRVHVGGPGRRSGRSVGFFGLRAAAAAAAVCLVAAMVASAPHGCRGWDASRRRSDTTEPPWRAPTAALSTLAGQTSSVSLTSSSQRSHSSRTSPQTVSRRQSTHVPTRRAAAVRQQAPSSPRNAPKPTSYAKDYATLELPRRKTREVYFYTRLVLVEPKSTRSGSNFGITALRKAIAKRLGGVSAEQVVMVHVMDLPSRSTTEVNARSVSIFMALRPEELPPASIEAFNAQVSDGTFSRVLREEIPASTRDVLLFSVEQDRPLIMDRASMLTHGPSGQPKAQASAAAPTKSKLPIIVGVVGGVAAVAMLVIVGWCIHARRSAARVASPRDLTRYSEESGTRQSSFPSSLASLPLPSFRSSLERPRKVHPDDDDRAG